MESPNNEARFYTIFSSPLLFLPPWMKFRYLLKELATNETVTKNGN
jgi:hypothetical protein